MQEVNQVSTPITPVATPTAVVEQPKSNNFLVILLSVLLFLSVSIAGFFAYQTQKLVKELTILKSGEKIVAVATTESTTEPVATEASEIDPTTNWKTYTDEIYKFSFKYPSDWNINCPALPVANWYDRNICDIISPKAFAEGGEVSNGSYFVVGVSKSNPNYSNFNQFLEYSKQYGYIYESKQINNISGKLATTKGKETNYIFERNGNYINATWLYSDNSKLVDQILSTFKFIN